MEPWAYATILDLPGFHAAISNSIPGQDVRRQLDRWMAPFCATHAAPPLAAGRVIVYRLDRVPAPHVTLHAPHADQLPMQATAV
jgi:hypothetical protein